MLGQDGEELAASSGGGGGLAAGLEDSGEGPLSAAAALSEGAGLIPRIYDHLLTRIGELTSEQRTGREVSFTVTVALIEIYKEQVGAGPR